MKKLFLSILFLGAGFAVQAQKSEVNEIKKAWDVFENLGRNLGYEKSLASLNAGLKRTDVAIAHDKSKGMPEAWSYRALFASAIAVVDTTSEQNSYEKQKIAKEAIQEAKRLDTKGTEASKLELADINLRNALSGIGVRAYQRKDYQTALKTFNAIIEENPQDTSMYINAGVTAKLVEDYDQALKHFGKVISMNHPDARGFYSESVYMTLNNLKDTTKTLDLVKEALTKFPDDSEFIGVETDIYIARGDIQKSQDALNKLLSKDPKRPIYHYLMGETYYKQALNMQTERNALDVKKQKEFNELTAKMTAFIDQSIPFYEKTLELDPVFEPALETLKQIYGFKGDTEKFNAIKKRLDALPPSQQ